MSIRVNCPGCGKTVNAPSQYAGKVATCPGCGSKMRVPIPEAVELTEAKSADTPTPESSASSVQQTLPTTPPREETLIVTRPKMFRNHPIWFILCLLLSVVGIGLVVLSIWYMKVLTTTLTVTTKRTTLRQGILSKHTREVRHSDVRFLEVDQGILQRILGVGKLAVSSAGQGELEIIVEGIYRPSYVKDTIDSYRP